MIAPDAPIHAPLDADAVRIVRVGMDALPILKALNWTCFEEERVINRFDRDGLLMLLAYLGPTPGAFKIGYRESARTFYSAKGGVLPAYRRRGLARLLLHDMMARCRADGYRTFAYDTFPNRDPGMAILGFNEGFRLTATDYNRSFQDWRLRLEKSLVE